MITKEVNDWIKKVKTKNYSSWDIMEEFSSFSKYLTKRRYGTRQKTFKFYN